MESMDFGDNDKSTQVHLVVTSAAFWWGVGQDRGVYGSALYFPLSFAMDIKLFAE